MANPILDFEKLKPILLGEFKFPVEQSCSACYFNKPQEECEIYAGEVTFTDNVHVPWTTIKEILKAAAEATLWEEK